MVTNLNVKQFNAYELYAIFERNQLVTISVAGLSATFTISSLLRDYTLGRFIKDDIIDSVALAVTRHIIATLGGIPLAVVQSTKQSVELLMSGATVVYRAEDGSLARVAWEAAVNSTSKDYLTIPAVVRPVVDRLLTLPR